MNLLRAWTTLLGLAFRRLLFSAGTLMVMLPLGGCLAYLTWRYHFRAAAGDIPADDFNSFSEKFIIDVFVSILVPMCALAFGTASVGGDREDRTMVFLLVRPIPRALVLLAKFVATLPLVLGIVVGSFWLYCQVAKESGQLAFPLYTPAIVLGTLAYIGLFHLFAVSFRHATILALIYALLMEVVLGSLPGIVKRVAVNYYCRVLIYDAGAAEGLPTPEPPVFEPLPVDTATWWLLGIAGVSLVLAMLIFSRKEYRDLV